MKAAFDRAMVWTVDHRLWTTVFLLALTSLAVVGFWRPDLIRTLFIQEEVSQQPAPRGRRFRPNADTLPDVGEIFSLGEYDCFLVVQSEQFFSPIGAKAMRRVVEDLESLDIVRSVLWMDRIPILNIFGLSEPLFPRSGASPERFETARKKALKHPLICGQLLSEDCRTLLLLVSLDRDFVRSDEECTSGLRELAEQSVANFSEFKAKFQVTGRYPAFITAVRLHETNQLWYQLVGYGVIVVMAIVLFRGVRAVLVVSVGPILGVVWTLGILNFFDVRDNPFNDVILPVLLSLVGLTDGVHLMVLLRKLRAAGVPERDAARSALEQVGWACFLTSLTTAIGLGSLTLAHSEWVQEFGWCCTVGVTLTFFSTVLAIPLMCSTRIGRTIHVGYERSLIDRNLSRVSLLIDWVLRYPRAISIFGMVATLILTAISLTLRPDERRSNGLPMHSEAYQALMHMDQALGGLEFSEVQIHWSDQIPDNSPEILRLVIEVDELLHTEGTIGYPLSIRNLIDAQPGAEPGDALESDRMSLLELLPPPLKRAYYTPERNLAKVTFRVQDLGIAQYGPVFERLEAGLQRMQARNPEFQFELAGDAIRRWKNIYQIVVDLTTSLGSASIIIFFVLGLAYRSVRIGLISVIPNVFPLAITGSWLVVSGYSLEIVSVCAFTICLGIAVDDTIHFLTRFDEERELAPDRNEAIRRAFGNCGVGMVLTTVVLVAGFASVASSDSRDHHIFAMMGVLTIAAALVGDLFILPALLSWFAPMPKGPGNSLSRVP